MERLNGIPMEIFCLVHSVIFNTDTNQQELLFDSKIYRFITFGQHLEVAVLGTMISINLCIGTCKFMGHTLDSMSYNAAVNQILQLLTSLSLFNLIIAFPFPDTIKTDFI